MKFDKFSDIYNYAQINSEEKILHHALLQFYGISLEDEGDWPLSKLRERFDNDELRETAPNSEYFLECIQDIKHNIEQYEDIYTNYLIDAASRQIFCDLLAARLTLNVDYLRHAYTPGQIHYFDPALFHMEPGEVYADCGGYVGDTVLSFIHQCPTYQKIYVYEAAPQIMQECRKALCALAEDSSIVFRECAVFSEKSKLNFSLKSENGDSAVEGDGELTVSAVALDEDVLQPITFIKMDIEGSEIPAIMGAKKHIQNDTPKMAICIYHLKDDFWRIPQLIQSINPNYRFIIRHHQAYQFYDTVLYCIPKTKKGIATRNIPSEEVISERRRKLLPRLQARSREELEEGQAAEDAKVWCIRNLRSYRETVAQLDANIKELKTWAGQLQEGKAYLEQQAAAQDGAIAELRLWGSQLEASIAELRSWNGQLEEGKDYLEKQVAARDSAIAGQAASIAALQAQGIQQAEVITELRSWNSQLEEGKDYLEKQVTARDSAITEQEAAIAELRTWSGQLEEGKAYLEGQAAQLQQITDAQAAEIQEKAALIEGQEARIAQLETEKSKLLFYLGEEIRKPWYKKLISKSSESDYNL